MGKNADFMDDLEEDSYANELEYGTPYPEREPVAKFMVHFGEGVKARTDGQGNWFTRDGDRIYPTFMKCPDSNTYCDVTGTTHILLKKEGLRSKSPYLFNDVKESEFELIECESITPLDKS